MTQFEVGEKYKTKGGGWRFIESIDDDEYLPINALDEEGGGGWHYALDGKYHCSYSDHYDLLLPAIEEAGPALEMHPKVREALLAMRDFWQRFGADVSNGDLDPCNGGAHDGGAAYIELNYPDYQSALDEVAAITADIDRLLEGGAS